MTTETWTSGAVGNWSAAGEWSPASVPASGDTAVITAGSAELLSSIDPAGDITVLLGGPTVTGSDGPFPGAFLYTLNNTLSDFTIDTTTPGTEAALATEGITDFTGTVSVSGANTLLALGVDEPNPGGIKQGPEQGASNTVANPSGEGQFQNNGIIDIDGGAGMVVAPLNTLDNGAVSMLIGTIDLDDGTFASTYVTLGPPTGGFGTEGVLNLADGSTAAMQLSSNILVNFEDGNGDRLIYTSSEEGAVINGFQLGDEIVQTPLTFGSITQDYKNKGLSWNQAEHTLQVTTGVGGTPYLDYTLDGWYTTKDFRASDDGDGNLVITIACFAAGTMIATDRGEMPVEQLSTGDRVVTARRAGAPFRQINWIGHRQVSLRAHPDPAAVRPIRIRAGAFGAGLPRRDLRLSPDHAVFHGGALIPVRYLINGATIAPDDDCDAVDYFHLELSSHDVLLAEGLPAETYLDTGNRAAFANGGAIADLHPDFAWREWDARACAPLVLDGPRLLRVRRRLLANAAKLGHRRTRDAGLHVLADGRAIADPCDGATARRPPARRRRHRPAGLAALGAGADAGVGRRHPRARRRRLPAVARRARGQPGQSGPGRRLARPRSALALDRWRRRACRAGRAGNRLRGGNGRHLLARAAAARRARRLTGPCPPPRPPVNRRHVHPRRRHAAFPRARAAGTRPAGRDRARHPVAAARAAVPAQPHQRLPDRGRRRLGRARHRHQ